MVHTNNRPTNKPINGKRLWDSLMGFAEIGATAKGGVRRLTLTDVDKRARQIPRRVRGTGPDRTDGRDRQHVRPSART